MAGTLGWQYQGTRDLTILPKREESNKKEMAKTRPSCNAVYRWTWGLPGKTTQVPPGG